jgi:hypothetical protein
MLLLSIYPRLTTASRLHRVRRRSNQENEHGTELANLADG